MQPNFTIQHEGLTKENIISGFSSTGNFPVDSSKYKLSRLDKVKLQTYNKWKAKGVLVDEHEEPILEKVTDHSSIINDSNVDDTTLENAIRFSVSTTQSPAASKKSKERLQLPLSVATFDESMKSTADTTPPESTLNELKNETNVSDGLNQAYILEILQKNVPSGYKYCLTLVPRETGTLEKVLKNRNVSEKKKKSCYRGRSTQTNTT